MSKWLARSIGRLLRPIRAGDAHLALADPALAGVPQSIVLTSEWFADGSAMPLHAAGPGVGDNISPPLAWSNVPDGTEGYLLIVEDIDVPLKRPFVHLVALGIGGHRRSLDAGQLAGASSPGAPYGLNTSGDLGYRGPRALRGHGDHRYIFELLALSRRPTVPVRPTLAAVLEANAGHVLAAGCLTGLFRQD